MDILENMIKNYLVLLPFYEYERMLDRIRSLIVLERNISDDDCT